MYLPSKSKVTAFKRSDLVYHRLKQRLITGELPQGARVDVNELVKEMELSRQPVLAAISKLSNEGFLKVIPQVGCWVATVETQQIEDFFRLFALTEGLSCELAALRRNPAGISALRAILEQTAKLLASESDPKRLSQQFFRLNREFHGQIHEMAESQFVGDLAGGMWDRCDFYLASADPGIQGERGNVSEDEHEQIVAAIEAGDAALAKRLMEAHIQSFGTEAIRRRAANEALQARRIAG